MAINAGSAMVVGVLGPAVARGACLCVVVVLVVPVVVRGVVVEGQVVAAESDRYH
ncbi:MAG: hypothetical protein OXB92_09040 [Acidimicrobiaceae bacterium]|nr:hypothetical protein [Acidimicrobiia bacterium]MCY4493984.1 hypothetical protein [Acidimicrobiaceae bacterium]